MAAEVSAITGREFRIRGAVSFRLLPSIAVVAHDLSLANAAWGSQPDMLRVDHAAIEIAVWPLLQGRVELTNVVLEGASVLVETGDADISNWALTPTASIAATKPGAQGTTLTLERLQVDALRLDVVQAGSGRRRTVVLRSLSLAPQAEASRIAATLQIEDRDWSVEATTGRLDALLARQAPWPIAATLATDGARLAARGSVPVGLGAPWQFDVDAALSDAKVLDRLVPVAAMPLHLPVPMGLQAVIHRDRGPIWRVEQARLTLAGQAMRGALEWMPGAVPRLTMRIDADAVDARTLRADPAAAVRPTPGQARTGQVFPDVRFAIDHWPAFEADIEARIARLQWSPTLELKDVHLTLGLVQSGLRHASFSLGLAGGSASGSASYLWSSEPAALRLRLDATRLALADLAPLARQSDVLRGGMVDLMFDLNATGTSPRQIAASVDGEVRAVARQMRLSPRVTAAGTDVLSGLLRSLRPAHTAQQDSTVTCAVVRLPLKAGRAVVDRLIAAESDEVDVVALGAVDLRQETLSLAFRPRVKRGIGVSAARLAGLVRLEGPLAAPRLVIDSAGTANQMVRVGAAVATGGWSLIGERLLQSTAAQRPCATALRGIRAQPKKPVAAGSRGAAGR